MVAGELALALPPLVMLGLLLYWATDKGGFPPTVWYPGALLALWLLVICAGNERFSFDWRDRRTAALALLGLFTLWSFLSIAWAASEGDAWGGANKALMYLGIYAIFSRWATSTKIAASFAALYALGVTAIGYITIERGLQSGEVGSLFNSWRLISPIGYQNAEAAFFLIPLWPALYLASRRELPPPLRGLMAASAGLLVQMTVLAQSRGSMFAFPVVFLLFIALSDGRGRALATSLVVFGASVFNFGRLLGVYRAGDRGDDVVEALSQARIGMLVVFFSLLLLGTLVALLERRVVLGAAFRRRLDRGFVGGFALALVLAAAIGIAAAGRPLDRTQDAWHNFRSGSSSGSSSSHFTSLYGTNRYDFWRVATSEFRDHPVAGIGSGNFSSEYLLARRSVEEPSDPHSIEFKVLVQTGLIGALLFAGFLATSLAATRSIGKDVDPFRKGLAASLLAGFLYWLVHGSVEWFWELPALTGAALAFLGIAASLASSGGEEAGGRTGRKLVLIPLLGLALVATASFGAPWLSARYVNSASRSWQVDPGDAYEMLDHARALDPLSDMPDLIAGTIAGRRGDYPRMKSAFARALERNERNWYAHFELGIAEYMIRDRRSAIAQIERAQELNPRESLIRAVLEQVRAGEKVDLEELDRAFLARAEAYSPGAD